MGGGVARAARHAPRGLNRSLRMAARSKNGDRAQRRIAAGFSLLLLLVVLSPVRHNWSPEPRDDFPLSYYPMFSFQRGRTVRVSHLEGVDARGNAVIVPYRFLSDGGFNYMRKFIRRGISVGAAGALCERAASNLAKSADPAYAEVVMVRVVTGEYLLQSFYEGRVEADATTVHARCGVAR